MAARKKTQKKRMVKKQTASKKGSESKSPKTVLKWEFPARELHILRIEALTLLAFGVFIFWFMYHQFEQRFFGGVLSAVLFIALYFVISAIVKRMHYVEEKYHLTDSHLEIERHVNGKKVQTKKIKLSDIILHKFDHLFLGAYVVTKEGRHSLFFNSSKESRKVHGHIQKKKWD